MSNIKPGGWRFLWSSFWMGVDQLGIVGNRPRVVGIIAILALFGVPLSLSVFGPLLPIVPISVGVVLFVGLIFWGAYVQWREARTEITTLQAKLDAIPGSPTAPILAEPQLFFSNLFCSDFGHGGEGNFGGLDSAKWYGYVSMIANAQSTMTITRIALMIDGHEHQAVRWNAREVGVGNYLCSFPVEIAQTIGTGRHEANIVAFAKGKSWRSPDFLVEVPSH